MTDQIVITVVDAGTSPIVIDGANHAMPTITNGGVIEFTFTGDRGPPGPQGPPGPAGNAGPLAGVTDVALSGVADGDVLRYQSNTWRNFKETDLTLDGGNF